MSAGNLISTMKKLLKLHQSLLELAAKKTDIVIKGDMDALKQIMKDEQVHIAAIGKFESERQRLAEVMVSGMSQPTIMDCINVAESDDKDQLHQLRTEILDLVSRIKEKNDLNQQLIYQSLHFVNLSLSLILPQPEEYNYGPEMGKISTTGYSPGLFNSKA